MLTQCNTALLSQFEALNAFGGQQVIQGDFVFSRGRRLSLEGLATP